MIAATRKASLGSTRSSVFSSSKSASLNGLIGPSSTAAFLFLMRLTPKRAGPRPLVPVVSPPYGHRHHNVRQARRPLRGRARPYDPHAGYPNGRALERPCAERHVALADLI